MNLTVLTLAAVGGLVLGLLIYWINRSAVAAVSASAVTVGLVAALLPWDAEPVEQRIATPSAEISAPSAEVEAAEVEAAEVEAAEVEAAEVEAAEVEAKSRMATLTTLAQSRPVEVPADGYVGSDACRECHPQNHETWHASYHRTMTQLATPETVLGDFNDVHLSDQGVDCYLRSDGDVCWVDIPDLTLGPDEGESRVQTPIVMTTGSHHMQAYWFALGHTRTLGILPFVYLKETKEWIPRSAAFLRESNFPNYEIGRWNLVCSQCHSTHRREHLLQKNAWDTQVSEFGISCEACHGPGQQHIEFQRALKTDSSLGEREDPIVNPATLSKEKSSQACGQCHSVRMNKGDKATINRHGSEFRPGDDLNETHVVMQRDSRSQHQVLGIDQDLEFKLNQTYYRDGMVRVSGREYNGLVASACHQRGEMTCLTCHQMHKSESDPRALDQWANDQLRPDALGDQTCLKCHSADQYDQSHTHHAAGSSGASCYNCHMPHTSYGLLKSIRNHTISSPDVGKDVAAGRPNACNLCHLDQTLQWTSKKLHDWYEIEPPELDRDRQEVAASLLWILKGDAAQRAIASWAMGWPVAQQTSGTTWQAPFLAHLLDDPYLAIRLIARRSLRTLDGFSDLQVDVFAPVDTRWPQISSIAQEWSANLTDSSIQRSELLFTKDGIQVERIERLRKQRDDTPVNLAE